MSIGAVHIAEMAGAYQNPAAYILAPEPNSQNDRARSRQACSPKPPRYIQTAGASQNLEVTAPVHRWEARMAGRVNQCKGGGSPPPTRKPMKVYIDASVKRSDYRHSRSNSITMKKADLLPLVNQ